MPAAFISMQARVIANSAGACLGSPLDKKQFRRLCRSLFSWRTPIPESVVNWYGLEKASPLCVCVRYELTLQNAQRVLASLLEQPVKPWVPFNVLCPDPSFMRACFLTSFGSLINCMPATPLLAGVG